MHRGKKRDLYSLSRKALLKIARARGIVNAGVLGKIHLIYILKGATKRETAKYILVGCRKWRAGWGKRGGRKSSRVVLDHDVNNTETI